MAAKKPLNIGLVGCGFMGLMFVQALSRGLLDRFAVIDVDARRLELARRLGASETYNAKEVDAQALREIGFDTVVDCSGSQAGLDLSSKLVRNGGRLNLFGWNHGTGNFPGDLWHMNGITVVNSAPNSAERDPWPAAIRMLQRRYIDLEPLVSHVVSLDEYPALLALAASRDPMYLKGVVDLTQSATLAAAA